MNILYANIIVYLTRYVTILRCFFRNKTIKLLIDMFKWGVIAYAFTLVKGYSVTLCYMFLIVYEVMKFIKINKIILFDIAIFMICASFIFFSNRFSLFYLLPYVALFINMVLKPMLKPKYKKYNDFLINIIICAFSYYYHIYVLFIFRLLSLIFPMVGASVKKITNYTDMKTN